MDLDTLLFILIALIPIIMAVLGGHVWSEKKWQKATFWIMGLVFAGLIIWQGIRIQKSKDEATNNIQKLLKSNTGLTDSNTQLKNSIDKQKQEIANLKQTIADTEKENAKLTRQQLKIQEKQFAINSELSVDITYRNKGLYINNIGKTNLFIYGDKFDNEPIAFDEPRMIAPGRSLHISTESFEKAMLANLGLNGETRISYQLFVKDTLQQKFVVKCFLWIVVNNGQLTINTQNLGIERSNWSK